MEMDFSKETVYTVCESLGLPMQFRFDKSTGYRRLRIFVSFDAVAHVSWFKQEHYVYIDKISLSPVNEDDTTNTKRVFGGGLPGDANLEPDYELIKTIIKNINQFA